VLLVNCIVVHRIGLDLSAVCVADFRATLFDITAIVA
jgi:hypothetical protein